jgi:XTP/dITP diphosphohydrolase
VTVVRVVVGIVTVATKNPGKACDMHHLLGASLELRSLPADAPDVEETGSTFADNAILKARAAAAFVSGPAIGDDSGLEVDALAGAPGVYSARFAAADVPRDADRRVVDAANNLKLLAALRGIPSSRRTARFRSVLAFVDGPSLIVADGVCEGLILEGPRGTGGFGYDPLFFCPALGATFGEADIAAKGRVSHRAQAAAVLLPRLRAHFEVANTRKSQ